MATQTSISTQIMIHQSVPRKKSVFSMVMFRKSQLYVKKAAKLQIRCSIRDQVFDDHTTGIICYKDERGEMICEGFDEGPRLLKHHYPSRDGDFLDRLQWRWLQLMNGETVDDTVLLKNHSFNGFKALP